MASVPADAVLPKDARFPERGSDEARVTHRASVLPPRRAGPIQVYGKEEQGQHTLLPHCLREGVNWCPEGGREGVCLCVCVREREGVCLCVREWVWVWVLFFACDVFVCACVFRLICI